LGGNKWSVGASKRRERKSFFFLDVNMNMCELPYAEETMGEKKDKEEGKIALQCADRQAHAGRPYVHLQKGSRGLRL